MDIERPMTQKELNKAIVEKLDKILEQLKSNQTPSRTFEVPLQDNVTTSTKEASQVPVPMEYQKLVEEILNSAFGVEVRPKSDAPAFDFVIRVPRKYSNAPPGHWDMYKCDERVKMLAYSDGLLGVKDWCERVFNNFNQETKTIIVNDRTNTQ